MDEKEQFIIAELNHGSERGNDGLFTSTLKVQLELDDDNKRDLAEERTIYGVEVVSPNSPEITPEWYQQLSVDDEGEVGVEFQLRSLIEEPEADVDLFFQNRWLRKIKFRDEEEEK